jgi:hypothetical protein
MFARLQPAVGGAFLTPNEARAEVGLERIEGGDAINQPPSFGAGLFGGFGGDKPSEEAAAPAKVLVRPLDAKRY